MRTLLAGSRNTWAAGGLSGFVDRVVDHELERDALTRYLDDLDAEFGPTALVRPGVYHGP